MLDTLTRDKKMIYECTQCGYTTESNDPILYTQTYDSVIRYTNPNQIKNIIHDPTIARTVKYTCPNEDCSTHSNESIKEALFWRDPTDMTMNMVCRECKTSWKS